MLLYAEDNHSSTFYRYHLKDEGGPEEVKLTAANDIASHFAGAPAMWTCD